MQIKTIERLISKKFNEWVASIDDEKVRDAVKDNTIISGGCIASLLLKEKINDFDLYFANEETAQMVAVYYVGFFNDLNGTKIEATLDDGRIRILVQGIEKENKGHDEEYRPVCITTNAITLSDKIQIITRFYGDADTIHENFDYIHCTNYWDSGTKKVTTNKQALESLLSKHLFYSGSKYPLCSIIRSRKFIQRGWRISAGQYLKMCLQLQSFDLGKVSTLKEQLLGVDAAYFNILIRTLESRQEKGTITGEIDASYIVKLIDEIF